MLEKLRRPYVLETSIARRWRASLFFGLFVFLFLLVFQPFGLNNWEGEILQVSFGYGLTTFLIATLLNIVVPLLLRNYFSEEKWTVGREFFWILLNISVIGLGNAIYNNIIQQQPFSFYSLLLLEAYTLSVGVFPVAISILIREARLKKRYETTSGEINAGLKEQHDNPVHKTDSQNEMITIPSENTNENFTIAIDDLIYIQSADNYIEVFYLKKQVLSKKLLRSTLKAVSESLETNPVLFRCHKSYLVNLRKVNHVSGNAQGYKLQLTDCETLIPVSRQLNTEIKTRLAVGP